MVDIPTDLMASRIINKMRSIKGDTSVSMTPHLATGKPDGSVNQIVG